MNRLVKIGLFAIITASSLTFYIMKTTDSLNYGELYELVAYMDDASGLYKETKVKMAGVAVGQVKEIELSGSKAKIIIEISKDITLYKDAIVAKTLESMLGTYALTISPGTDTQHILGEGDTVDNVLGSGIMNEMLASTEGLSSEAGLLIQDLRSYYTSKVFSDRILNLIDEMNETNLQTREMVKNNMVIMSGMLESLANIASKGEDSTDAAVMQMTAILDNIRILTESMNTMSNEKDAQLTDILASLKESTDSLRLTMDSVNRSSGSVEDTLSAMENGEGTAGKLLTDETLYDQIMNMSGMAEDYLNSSIGLNIQIGAATEYGVMSQEFKNSVEARLTPPDSNKYYKIGFVDTTSGSESTNTTKTTVTSSDGVTDNQSYTTTETTTSDDMKLNIQIARKYGDITLRGGLLGGSAGGGFDYQPLNQFSLSGEIFDFASDEAPYVRTWVTLYPFFDPDIDNPLNWLYLSAGGDNLLRSDRDFFAGAGLRFTDNDIKVLLGNIPQNN